MRPLEPIRFASTAALLAQAFRHLAVPERLTVSEAALRHRRLENPGGGYSGAWTFERAPYLRRPMDCLLPSSGYSMVAVMGPAQSGKSEVGNNWMLHSAICDPADMLFVGPDKQTMSDYVIKEIDKMIRLAPALQERQLATSSADNRFLKQFVGSNWFMAWPVKSQFRARALARTRIDDYDALPEDIDGEGNALMLISGRQTTFEGFEMTFVNSSPALGPDRGIEAVVAGGTDERWHVPCLHCREDFALDLEAHLTFDRTASPDEAKASAAVACPACGGLHAQADKPALMAAGDWVAASARRTSIASFRIDGLMGFASWGRLAELYRTAELTFERTQDEGELRAFCNTRAGKNYRSRLAGALPVDASALELRARESGYRLGTVPPGVVCLTGAIDVQGRRFEAMVVGWGEGLQCWIVDRFPLLALDDGTTAIDPGGTPEHWGVLVPKVIWRRYPLSQDPSRSLPVLNTAIDTGGLEGVTDNAFRFWYTARRLGIPSTSITLVKGGNKPTARLLPPPTIEANRKRKGEPDAEFWVPNVHRVKDVIDVRLRRQAPGPGYIHLPADIERRHLDELTAEQKVDGLWQRKKGAANETLDLMVYATVALIRHGGTDASLSWVPAWARPGPTPAGAVPVLPARTPDVAPGTPDAAPVPALVEPTAPPAPRRRGLLVSVRGSR